MIQFFLIFEKIQNYVDDDPGIMSDIIPESAMNFLIPTFILLRQFDNLNFLILPKRFIVFQIEIEKIIRYQCNTIKNDISDIDMNIESLFSKSENRPKFSWWGASSPTTTRHSKITWQGNRRKVWKCVCVSHGGVRWFFHQVTYWAGF